MGQYLRIAPTFPILHCFLECPSISPVIASLRRVLHLHFHISIDHPAQLLFALPRLPLDGFPFLPLLAFSLRCIWISRCRRRFDSSVKHPRALLHLILRAFLIFSNSHFLALRTHPSSKNKKRLREHYLTAKHHHIFIFTDSQTPFLHPLFKAHWLLYEPYIPP